MNLTIGIDVGSSMVKTALVRSDAGGRGEVVALRDDRIRRRDPSAVVEEAYTTLL